MELKELDWEERLAGKVSGRLPWETPAEYAKFCAFRDCPRPRSVRKAYELFCRKQGITPRKDPPSSWYALYRGECKAFRRAKKLLAAVERAEKAHGREPDWEGLQKAIERAKREGKLERYEGVIGEIMDALTLIEWAFWSLAVDEEGNPLPGVPTWEERREAYWKARERKREAE